MLNCKEFNYEIFGLISLYIQSPISFSAKLNLDDSSVPYNPRFKHSNQIQILKYTNLKQILDTNPKIYLSQTIFRHSPRNIEILN